MLVYSPRPCHACLMFIAPGKGVNTKISSTNNMTRPNLRIVKLANFGKYVNVWNFCKSMQCLKMFEIFCRVKMSEKYLQGKIWPAPKEQTSVEEFLVLRSNSFRFQVLSSSNKSIFVYKQKVKDCFQQMHFIGHSTRRVLQTPVIQTRCVSGSVSDR